MVGLFFTAAVNNCDFSNEGNQSQCENRDVKCGVASQLVSFWCPFELNILYYLHERLFFFSFLPFYALLLVNTDSGLQHFCWKNNPVTGK